MGTLSAVLRRGGGPRARSNGMEARIADERARGGDPEALREAMTHAGLRAEAAERDVVRQREALEETRSDHARRTEAKPPLLSSETVPSNTA